MPINPQTEAVWNDKYRHERFAYGTEPNVFIKTASAKYLTSPKRVVELASGEGRNVVHLAKAGHHVSAVDMSSEGLKKTRVLAESQGVDPSLISYFHEDCVTWTPPEGPGTIDVAVMSFCHIMQQDKPAFFQNLINILAPGGLLIVEVFHPDQISKGYRAQSGGPPDPSMMFTIEEFRDLLPNGKELESNKVEYVLQEGPLHNGLGAVTRYVWKKQVTA